MRLRALGPCALVLAACTVSGCAPDAPSHADAATTLDASVDTLDAGALEPRPLLPRRHAFDPARARRGRDVLAGVAGARVPWVALRSLWVVWGRVGLDDEAYWAELASRYGFVPRAPGELPYGLVRQGDEGVIQCLACHVDRVAGEARVGAGNGRLRISALHEDLLRLAEIAPSYGFAVPPIPEVWRAAFEGRTGGPGATDAFGMGMTLAAAHDPTSGIETRYGFQQPAAWWTLAFKDRTYVDGAGSTHGVRTMLATTLASGTTLAEIMSMEDAFEDVRHYLLSLEAPSWPFAAPAEDAVATGRALFDAQCAGCHGRYGGAEAGYPEVIADVGTDPVRHRRVGVREVEWIDATWFGDPPLEDTDGYLAPPLLGVWATAPYLHNGSVPDLRALMRPSERPSRWRRLADSLDDYDPTRVGVRFEPAAAGDPLAYDTATEGLSAAGHELGAELTDGEVDALLAYLVTL